MDDELLIEYVRDFPHLYDVRSKHYKDTIKKTNSWQSISEKFSDVTCKVNYIFT